MAKDVIGRRGFIKGTAFAGAVAGLYGSGWWETVMAKEPGPDNPDPLPPTRIYPVMPRATVAVVGVSGTIESAVRDAVEMAGGLKEIEKGQKVLIKPNICGPAIKDKYPGRITTDPEVVRAVIHLVKERGAIPLVGDRAMINPNLSFETTGFARLCKEEGVIGFPWNKCEYVWFYPKKRYWTKGFRIPRVLVEADHFINVPLLKNHEAVVGADFTCCMKSYVGICHKEDRNQPGLNALHLRDISAKIAELNLCKKPTINIVDALTIMVKGGPDGLRRKSSIWCNANVILASKDRVACDSVALAVLKRYGAENKVALPYVNKSVWDQPQIYYAAELGLGQAEADKISVIDKDVKLMDEIKSNWV